MRPISKDIYYQRQLNRDKMRNRTLELLKGNNINNIF